MVAYYRQVVVSFERVNVNYGVGSGTYYRQVVSFERDVNYGVGSGSCVFEAVHK